ncbi:LOW QUALITY PROTEIN: chromodomain-helicase-DNA-binding protein 7-like [Pollicipes pollicipes]|uniref:LOW QUALITY PROTEIN: chromodomain-helicase-DNA-binding protein 7-like n=1 Tax=Pollicipes pollicipes TaxID=41117 RepID=UPI001884EEED|nr:LOW QUALITY PROTEIN: chromodomain-helicase-DNA-binding protein 7-like [Pollicipes pollicipes]
MEIAVDPPAAKRGRKRGAGKPRERKKREAKPRSRTRKKAAAAAETEDAEPEPAAADGEALPADADGDAAKPATETASPTKANKRRRTSRSKKKAAAKADEGPVPEAAEPTPADSDAAEKSDTEETAAAAAAAAASAAAAKPARPRVKSATPSRKKPKAKLALNFKKKKRRRGSDSEASDLEKTPPPSPPPDDLQGGNKRRSGRNAGGRKKYVDDLDLRELAQISDEETKKEPVEGQAIAPNCAFINTNDEDSMIVQYILGERKGRREVIPDEPEPAAAVKKEVGGEQAATAAAGVDPADGKPAEAADAAAEPGAGGAPHDGDGDATDAKQEGKTDANSDAAPDAKTDSSPDAAADSKPDASPDSKPVAKTDAKVEAKTAAGGAVKKEAEFVEMDEFYVKYKNFSYLHCEWRTEDELQRGDRRISSKIKRYQQKKQQSHNVLDFLDEELYNPDFVEVDRVLDVSEYTDPNTGEKSRHFLVKWRSLSYEDCTWELEDDVDKPKITSFFRFKEPPPKEQRTKKKRPKPSEWNKLDRSPCYKNANALRDYQLEGLNWLTFSYYNGHNCILADEMGLGKTIQALTFVHAVFEYGIRGPFLVIAPLSTIPNWQREFEAWTDLNVIVYHGTSASRNMIAEYEMYYKDADGQRIPDMYKFHVCITTYEVVIQDCLELSEVPWRVCVIDEAHRLKNANCKLLEGLRLLDIEHRVLLSGTPLQNNIRELFSLLNFLEPQQFASEEAFNSEFGELRTDEQVKKLQLLLKPMMLRRLKEDVEKSLAPKEETIIEVELTNIQKKYYRGILEKNFTFLAKGSSWSNLPNLMNTMMELRKCCIHPYLINGAEDQIQHEQRQENKEHLPDGVDTSHFQQAMVQSAGKLVLVDKLLPKLKAQGHRVLIFSQMVRMLDILEDYLIFKKYPFERIDGRIRGDLRQAAIDRYCRPDSDRFVFLLCTKAGGLGINLTAADTVIIYDSDWNPQNDLQAQARCHRIGQQKMVKVYRLITRNTYEREMFDRASLKLGLDKAVLQSMNTGQQGKGIDAQKQLSKKEVEILLKKGAYGALMDDDTAGKQFCEEDIDQILEKRTQVITFEEEKGSSFSKASFSTAGNRSDIDVDDPDFWNKWAKRAEVDQDEGPAKNELIVAEPRRRSRIKRYGQEEALLQNVSDIGSSSDTDDNKEKTDAPSRRRGRSSRYRPDEDADFISGEGAVCYGNWTRHECFKVEKQLLVFGWGRWAEILKHGGFRDGWTEAHVEDLARLVLLQCIKVYKGDDKIRGFVFDLISPSNQGTSKLGRNHMGLSAPVPRGRKGKKKQREAKLVAQYMEESDWSKDKRYNTEVYLDRSYHRHLNRHSNKVLLRVRMLFYVETEIIGDLATKIMESVPVGELNMHTPWLDQPPVSWWDRDADRSLLVGTYRHGYERYHQMRQDPALVFLTRCGPPDGAAPGTEAETDTDVVDDDLDKEDTESSAVASPAPSSDTTRASTPAPSTASEQSAVTAATVAAVAAAAGDKLPFPSNTDLNTRLRRLVTAYQRNYKREEQKLQAQARRNERREKIEQIVREREMRKLELTQKRWSRQEEASFLRVVAAFGVEYHKKENRYDWSRFRVTARLDKKLDDTLTEYYQEFRAMCQRVAAGERPPPPPPPASGGAAPPATADLIPRPQAVYLMERIELLNTLRNEVVAHAHLEDRLKLCEEAPNLPAWWTPGKHDRDLIIGAVRHGIGNSGFYILHDPDLSFRDVITRHMKGMKLVDKKDKQKYADWRATRKRAAPPPAGDADQKPEGKEKAAEPCQDDADKPEATEVAAPADEADGKTGPPPTSDGCGENGGGDAAAQLPNGETGDELPEEKPAPAPAEKAADPSVIDATPAEAKCNGDDAGSEHVENGEEPAAADATTDAATDAEGGEDVKDEAPGAVAGSEEPVSGDTEPAAADADATPAEPAPAAGKAEKAPSEAGGSERRRSDEPAPAAAAKEEAVLPRLPNPATQPLMGLYQMEESISKYGHLYDPEVLQEAAMIQMLHQSYAAPIQWPSDHTLHMRLQHIVRAVDTGAWPTVDYTALPADPLDPGLIGVGQPRDESRPSTSRRGSAAGSSSGPLALGEPAAEAAAPLPPPPPSAEEGERRGRKRRHGPSEADAERAKLRALLNHNLQSITRLSGKRADSGDVEDLAAADEAGAQPPPAHQHGPRGPPAHGGMDLSFKAPAQQSPRAATPGPPHAGHAAHRAQTPKGDDVLDLSASLNKSRSSTPHSEKTDDGVLDLHVRSGSRGARLDSTLDRLKKRTGEEATGKEKKRRKLDSIISGLSAKTSGPPSASSVTVSQRDMTPSVSITPVPRAAGPLPPPAHGPRDDLFPDITLSRSCRRAAEPAASSSAAAAAAAAAALPAHDMHKPDSKVHNWLESQQKTSPAGGRGAVSGKLPASFGEPPAVDWSRLSPETPVPVVHRFSGKKLSGSAAPQLKNLAQWLLENSMYDVDPHWATQKSGSSRSKATSERRKGPGRPPMSPPSTSGSRPSASAATSSSLFGGFGGKMDPKNPLFGMDPKNLLYGMDPKMMAAYGLDPRMMYMDPKVLASMGLDAKAMASMGMDPKMLAAMSDPKMLAAMSDPKALAAMSDPKGAGFDDGQQDAAAMGLDMKTMASMGMDPKLLSSMGVDPKAMAAMGLDLKALASMGLDPKALASMGLDPKAMAAMGLDAKTLSAMGLDPKALASLGMDSKAMAAMGLDSKAMASMGLDPKTMTSMGMDAKSMAASMGLDPKAMASAGLDSKAMSAMGLDPKTMAAMGLDPKAIAAMGLDPKAMAAMGLDPKALAAMSLDPKAMAAMGLDPKAMASMGLDPKAMAAMGLDPKAMAAMGLDQKAMSAMGLDPKAMAAMGLDPKSMAAMGLDPKMLAMMAGLDPKMNPYAAAGLDPRVLSQLDPKTLSSLTMDPKMYSMMGLDPKMFGIDPKMLMDPKLMGGVDPRMFGMLASMDPRTSAALAGLDPKTLAQMDPAVLASLGIDPKLLQMLAEPKASPSATAKSSGSGGGSSSSSAAAASSSAATSSPSSAAASSASITTAPGQTSTLTSPSSAAFAAAAAGLYGLDPSLLQGLDYKQLAQLGLDSKALAAMSPRNNPFLMGMDPKLLAGYDPKMMQGMDPKSNPLLAGLDPKLLQGLDSKALAALDPKNNPYLAGMSGLDPKSAALMANFGMDPKSNPFLAGLDLKALGLDPKALGLDPKHPLYGIDPKMLGIDMNNPMMFGMGLPGMYPGLGLPPMSSGADPSSRVSPKGDSKADKRAAAAAAAAASAANLSFGSLFPPQSMGSMMYPPVAPPGWPAGASFANPLLTQSSLFNGLGGAAPGSTATVSSTRTKPTPSSTVTSEEAGGGERRAEREKIRSLLKDKVDIKGGLTKEQRNLLKERKRERLMKEQDGSLDLRAREQLEAAERLAREMERERRAKDKDLDAKERRLAEAQAALLCGRPAS